MVRKSGQIDFLNEEKKLLQTSCSRIKTKSYIAFNLCENSKFEQPVKSNALIGLNYSSPGRDEIFLCPPGTQFSGLTFFFLLNIYRGGDLPAHLSILYIIMYAYVILHFIHITRVYTKTWIICLQEIHSEENRVALGTIYVQYRVPEIVT